MSRANPTCTSSISSFDSTLDGPVWRPTVGRSTISRVQEWVVHQE